MPIYAVMIRNIARLMCQTWFASCAVFGVALTWILCVVVYTLSNGTIDSKQKLCCKICHYFFRWFLVKSCPWVQVSTPQVDELEQLLDRDRVFLLLNHTSFFDSVLVVAIMPTSILPRYRTLLKHKLLDVSTLR